LDTEIQAMKLLNHENIVCLSEILQDDTDIYLFMEVCGGGTLYDYLKDVPFSEPIARWYFDKLLDGLIYCHQSGVVHRDLRIENLLLDNKGTLKISDFGHSRIFSPGWDLFQTQMVGSLFHLSPEQIQGKIYSGEKVDIWSIGIILYTFLTSHMPFCSQNVQEMLNDICEAKYEYPEGSNVSESAKQLISKLIQVDPDARPSLKEIKECEWLKLEKEEPKLSILKKTFPVEVYEETKGKMMRILRELKVHFSAKQNNIVQCVYVLMGLKFHVLIHHNEEGKCMDLEFTLNSGDIKEFRKFIKQVEKLIQN
jgi:serine/threonine protein kinase